MSCAFSNNNGAARCLPDYGMGTKLHAASKVAPDGASGWQNDLGQNAPRSALDLKQTL
jgi:hypothetical protein